MKGREGKNVKEVEILVEEHHPRRQQTGKRKWRRAKRFL